jgi:hypothetical protein
MTPGPITSTIVRERFNHAFGEPHRAVGRYHQWRLTAPRCRHHINVLLSSSPEDTRNINPEDVCDDVNNASDDLSESHSLPPVALVWIFDPNDHDDGVCVAAVSLGEDIDIVITHIRQRLMRAAQPDELQPAPSSPDQRRAAR